MMFACHSYRLRRAHSECERGFTLIELIIVIVILGVMAVFIAPRVLDLTSWRLRAFADDLQSTTSAMQRRALANRQPIIAEFTAGGVTFSTATCAPSPAAVTQLRVLNCPAGAATCIVGTAFTGSVTFNHCNSGAGLTSTGATLPIDVKAGTAVEYAFKIENDTGLIWRDP